MIANRFQSLTQTQTTMHFFLRCQFYNVIQAKLMSGLLNIDSSLPSVRDGILLDILLYENKRIDAKTNQSSLMCTLKLTKNSHRFDNSLV